VQLVAHTSLLPVAAVAGMLHPYPPPCSRSEAILAPVERREFPGGKKRATNRPPGAQY
jgi:hypothetical protein